VESLREKIKYLRKVKGWTQEQFARNLGVSLNTVQRWEMGKTEPSPLAKEKLQAVFQEILDENQLKLF
jgi:DNA-binding transcriptional regulator YiaG